MNYLAMKPGVVAPRIQRLKEPEGVAKLVKARVCGGYSTVS
jgi:hypothetical protein